jgi:hypothetical protein
MKTPSSRTVGARSRAASNRSLSSNRVQPAGWVALERGSTTDTSAAPPEPPAIGFFTVRFLAATG